MIVPHVHREYLRRNILPLATGAFFAGLIIIAWFTVADYGITWDEKMQFLIGEMGMDFFLGGPWMQYGDKEHFQYFGATFEILLTLMTRLSRLEEAQSIFFLRHFLTFLSYFLGVAVLYEIGKLLWKQSFWALLGCVLFVLSPRIYGHAFYNSKDIPALAAFIVCIWTLMRCVERRRTVDLFFHAFACAVLLTIRLTGLFLVPLTLFFLCLPVGGTWKSPRFQERTAGMLLLYPVLLFAFTVILWPYLWHAPIEHFLKAYTFMSDRAFGSFFLGRYVAEYLWYWVPLWILITTPLATSFLFLAGTLHLLQRLFASPRKCVKEQWRALLILCWFFGPLSAVILLRAGMYDDWRHLFFVYPAFALLAVEGARLLHHWAKASAPATIALPALWVLLAMHCLLIAFWMIRNHPYQSLYFSLPAQVVEGKFELDYWGLTLRDGMEYVLQRETAPLISFYTTASSGWSVPNVLSPELRARVVLVPTPDVAMYILDNFRGNTYRKEFEGVFPKVHSITVGGIEVLGVYANPHPDFRILTPENVYPPRSVVFPI